MRAVPSRPTVPVDIDASTVALVQLAAERAGTTVGEWITRAARDAICRAPLAHQAIEWDEGQAIAEDAERAAEDAEFEAQMRRFRAAG
jgi:hypothetical protein